MKRKQPTILDDLALSRLTVEPPSKGSQRTPGDWIRIVRNYLRMTQRELAQRAQMTQANLAAIEAGKVDPQLGTLRRIYEGLSCTLSVEPRPQEPLEKILRGRARTVALSRLKQTMGTMALENQAPDRDLFQQLLEQSTDTILRSPRKRLPSKKHAG